MNNEELLEKLKKIQKRSDRVSGYLYNHDMPRAEQHLSLARTELNDLVKEVRATIEREKAKFKADAKRFNDKVQAETDAYLRRMDSM